MNKLETVQMIPRRRIDDARGMFLKVIDGFEEHLPPAVGEIYVVSFLPGQIRGNHFHPVTSEWFTVVEGSIQVVLYDPVLHERRELTLTGASPATIYVPAGIGHAFKAADDAVQAALMIAYADHRYDPTDTVPLRLLKEAES